MFNSITINFLYKIWSKIEHYYMFSILKVIIDKISSKLGLLFGESNFIKFLRNDKSYFEDSLLYKIYSFIIDKCNQFFNLSRKIFNRYKENSIIYKLIYDSTKDNMSISNTVFSSIMIFSGISLILNLRKQALFNNILVLIVLFIVSTLVLILKINVIEVSKKSFFVNLIESIFSVDEGDDKWW